MSLYYTILQRFVRVANMYKHILRSCMVRFIPREGPHHTAWINVSGVLPVFLFLLHPFLPPFLPAPLPLSLPLFIHIFSPIHPPIHPSIHPPSHPPTRSHQSQLSQARPNRTQSNPPTHHSIHPSVHECMRTCMHT